jgi:hypothetical protein
MIHHIKSLRPKDLAALYMTEWVCLVLRKMCQLEDRLRLAHSEQRAKARNLHHISDIGEAGVARAREHRNIATGPEGRFF